MDGKQNHNVVKNRVRGGGEKNTKGKKAGWRKSISQEIFKLNSQP